VAWDQSLGLGGGQSKLTDHVLERERQGRVTLEKAKSLMKCCLVQKNRTNLQQQKQ
jgi:hypothetical protein